MGRGNRRERGRLWAWIYLALFGGGETEREETGDDPGTARDAGNESAGERSGE
jgi:hypothetical protein